MAEPYISQLLNCLNKNSKRWQFVPVCSKCAKICALSTRKKLSKPTQWQNFSISGRYLDLPNKETRKSTAFCSVFHSCSWMSQEVSKRLGSVGYNRNIPHLQVGEITHLLTFTNFLGHPSRCHSPNIDDFTGEPPLEQGRTICHFSRRTTSQKLGEKFQWINGIFH